RGRQDADAVWRPGEKPGEQRHVSEEGDYVRLHVHLEKWREHEQAPDAVDDAGNAGEKFDGDADRTSERRRAEFGQKDGYAHPERNGDKHGDERCYDGSVDRGERAELLGDGVPGLGRKEAEAELLESGQR